MTSHSYSGNTKLVDNSAQQDQNIQTTPVQPIQAPPPPQSTKPQRNLLLAILCFFFGIPQILLPPIIALFITPQLNNLYVSLDIKHEISPIFYVVSVVLLIAGIANIYIGIANLKGRNKTKVSVITLVSSIVIQIVFIISTMLFVVNPIYQLVSSINSNPTPIITITPTPDPTSEWKKYVNTAVGFEIQYPNRYIETPGLPSGPGENRKADGSETNNHIIFGDTSTDTFGIQVFPHSGTMEDLLSSERIRSIPVYDWEGKTTSVSSSKIRVDSRDALLLTGNYINSSERPLNVVIFTRLNYGFILNFSKNYTEEEIDQILSTFKFTDSDLTPTPTCIPRPACLDATPQCLLPEPVNGWCP